MAQDGGYQGDDTSCTADPCGQSSGACCLPNGSCRESTRSACTADGGTYRGDNAACAPNPCAAPSGGGFVTFARPDGHVYRLEAREDALPEDITEALDALSPRALDIWLNISPEGDWLLLSTERFDSECAGGCLAIVKGDLSDGELVRAAGQLVHPDGFGAVASGGDLIVYYAGDGPHVRDLWAVTRSADAWSAPRVLTADSTFPFNSQPAISDDGNRVLFDCGQEPYGAEGTAICEVGTDGRGFRVVLTTADAPAGLSPRGALHHPDYDLDGGIVFEGDWDGEQLWRLSPGTDQPVRVVPPAGFPNDNSPCVLADGRIASLVIGQPGGPPDTHEIKVADAVDGDFFIFLSGEDIVDAGIGCGGSAGTDGKGGGGGTLAAVTSRRIRCGMRTSPRRLETRSRTRSSVFWRAWAVSGSDGCRLTFPSKFSRRMRTRRCVLSSRPRTGTTPTATWTPYRFPRVAPSRARRATNANMTAIVI